MNEKRSLFSDRVHNRAGSRWLALKNHSSPRRISRGVGGHARFPKHQDGQARRVPVPGRIVAVGLGIGPLVSLDVLWILQVILVGVGHVYSLWAAQKISRRLFTSEAAASRGQLPMLAGMILFSVLSLWLLEQPMEMRTSAM